MVSVGYQGLFPSYYIGHTSPLHQKLATRKKLEEEKVADITSEGKVGVPSSSKVGKGVNFLQKNFNKGERENYDVAWKIWINVNQ